MDQIEFVSLLALIQTPEIFHGQMVRVIGLCTLQFEGSAMWMSSEALQQAITKNAIWLSLPQDPALRQHDGSVMLVEGVFSAENQGHLGLFSGAIEDITRIEPWLR